MQLFSHPQKTDPATLVDDTLKRPCLRVFDVLVVNGSSLETTTLQTRRRILESILKEEKGRIELHPYRLISTEDDIMKALDAAIEQNEEGIVVKSPRSLYLPGVRSPFWIKIKPDYVQGMSEMPDLLVVGGWYGTGRHGKRLSHYLCAIRDLEPPLDSGSQSSTELRFRTICKVGTGTDFERMDKLTELPWKEYKRDRPPRWLLAGRAAKLTPDVYIEPSFNLVVQVKAEKFTPTPDYPAGWTMRFPRVERWRDDMSAEDVWSTETLHDFTVWLRSKSVSSYSISLPNLSFTFQDRLERDGRFANRLTEAHTGAAVKKRKTVRGAPLTVFASHALPEQGPGKTAEKGLFVGKSFCVLPAIGPDGTDEAMREIHALILENGGTLKNVPKEVDYVIADLPRSESQLGLLACWLATSQKSAN